MGEIIRQTINLYNTTGLVDKDKNIYFVPHQADIYNKVTSTRIKVCDCYNELFNEVSPFSSKYHDIDIDQWSPEDRNLVVDGIIDDFRQSRGRGLALNYMIVTRSIYEDDGETETLVNKYYQAFFIDSVEQSGSRSVKLNITPDYFTNLYYLNNEDNLTVDYDPFNPIMKNCFVERQHYNRFGLDDNDNILYTNLERILGSEESFKYKYQFKEKRFFLPLGVDINFADLESIYSDLKGINSKSAFLTLLNGYTDKQKKVVVQLFISYLNIILKDDILRPLAIRDGTFIEYCKPAYKKLKGVNIPYIHCVMPFIIIPNGFENIKKEWIKLTLNGYFASAFEDERPTKLYDFVGEENYNAGRLLSYLESIGGSQYIMTTFVSKYSPLFEECYRGIRFETDNIRIDFNVNMQIAGQIISGSSLPTDNSIIECNKPRIISHTLFSFLDDSYKEGTGLEAKSVIDTGAGLYHNAESQLADYSKGQYVYNDGYVDIELDTEFNTQRYSHYPPTPYDRFIFVLGTSEIKESTLKFNDGELTNLTLAKFFDPLLESDPYSFYSISLNETEQIISKTKLLYGYSHALFSYKILPIFSYNDSYKVGLIPSYYINEKWNRYYSETLVSVNSLELPVLTESWTTYYAQNRAQMKNQFAVQENNFKSGMAQTGVSGYVDLPNKMVKGGMQGGWAGAIVSGVTSLRETGGKLVNDAISNFYQKKNISLTQSSKMADMGAKPDTVKFSGSDILYDLIQNERGYYVNYYRIDEVSYDSACKYLERYGYLVNIFDSINVFDRVGLNFVKINSFDFVEDEFVLSQEQMEAVSEIFANGVTLLHNKDFLHNLGEVILGVNYHNYENLENIIYPKLSTPSIAINENNLYIEEVADAEYYDIYVDGVLVDTIVVEED